MDFTGKNVLITGARGGIGKATLEEFAKSGANIIAHARNESEDFSLFLQKVRDEYGVEIEPVYFDTTDYVLMKENIKPFIIGRGIDVLVNNAGINHSGLFQMTSVETIRNIFENNLFAHMELTQVVLKSMARKKSGAIVNVASTSGINIRPGNSSYGASKAAVVAWTKTLAYELGSQGIRVNAVAPGLTKTKMANEVFCNTTSDMIEKNVMGEMIEPSDIAKGIVFLASEDAKHINGEVLVINAGVV